MPHDPSTKAPLLPDVDTDRELVAGEAWLRERTASSGTSRLVLGVSGGIDSAVVARWAARALGPRTLLLVTLPYGLLAPSRFAASAPASLGDARLVAATLPGAEFRELDIAPTVDAEAAATGLAADLERAPDDPRLRLALANVKARVRAVRLRYFANRYDGLLLGTENKTEHFLGYFTIGGDEESDLEILGNYLKAEVRQLGAALGVPQPILDKAPSADLWAGQTDEAELGFTYADADHVLYLTNCADAFTPDAASACRVERVVADRVLARVRASAFKRAAKPVFPRTPPGGAAHEASRGNRV